MMATSDRTRFPPAWLILLAAFVYGGIFGLSLRNLGDSLKPDSYRYLILSDNLRHHHVFSSDETNPLTPELFRLPLYPLFLAISGATTPSSIRWAIGWQCLLGFLLVFLVWPFGYKLGGQTGAIFGAIFLCFDLVSMLHQNLILTEALFTFVFTLAVCLSLRYFKTPSLSGAWQAGVVFGIAALIKPIAIFVAGVFVLVSLMRWKNALALILATLGLPLLWVMHNWVVTGHPVYTVQGGLALIEYPATRALANDTGVSVDEAYRLLRAKLTKEGVDRLQDPVAISDAYTKLAVETMKQHPLATIKYCMTGGVRILAGTGLDMILDILKLSKPSTPHFESELSEAGTGTRRVLGMHPALIVIQAAYMIFLFGGYVLFGIGTWKLARKGQSSLSAFLLLSVMAILLISCHQGYYRFRIPLLPFLAFGVAASFGL